MLIQLHDKILNDYAVCLIAYMQEDVKDWTIDVINDALTRAEECAKRGSN